MSEFTISFEQWCQPCPWRRMCKFGKDKPLEVLISCRDLKYKAEELQFQHVTKVQKEGGDIQKAALRKAPATTILSEVWKEKVKSRKEEIYCINTNFLDLILVSNRSQEWWAEYSRVGKLVMEECAKIF